MNDKILKLEETLKERENLTLLVSSESDNRLDLVNQKVQHYQAQYEALTKRQQDSARELKQQ